MKDQDYNCKRSEISVQDKELFVSFLTHNSEIGLRIETAQDKSAAGAVHKSNIQL